MPTNDTYSIIANDLIVINNAVQSINSTAIFGLNFRDPKSATHAVNHAKAIDQSIGWKSVQSLEIGNENDLYMYNSIRSTNYDFDEYNKEWKMYTDAILAALPNRPILFEGATFAIDHWYPNISFYAKQHQKRLSSISIHNYPLTHCNNMTSTVDDLLTDKASQAEAEDIVKNRLVHALDAIGMPLYLGEADSVSCGGMPGVSNTFGSALWALDYMYNLAKVGVQRVNFHGGGGVNSYTTLSWPNPETEKPVVMPLFYAHHVFSRATSNNAKLVETQIDDGVDFVKVWASPSSTELNVVFLHKTDQQDSVNIALNISAPHAAFTWPNAHLDVLQAASLSEERQINFGDITWADTTDGEPSGEESFELISPLVSSDGSYAVYQVFVNSASAALMTIPLDGQEIKKNGRHKKSRSE